MCIEGGGGESKRGIVSCRAVRACVRAVWMSSENHIKFMFLRPSLSPFAMDPFLSPVTSSESR